MNLVEGWELLLYVALLFSLLAGLAVYGGMKWVEYLKRRQIRPYSQVWGSAIYLGTHRQNYRR